MLFRNCFFALILLASVVVSQGSDSNTPNVPARIIVSVRDQKLMVVENGQRVGVYPVSTSRFGIGDRWGSMATPLGWLQVAQKIGDHAPTGAVFHNRRFTGEILRPNAPGRDPIVTRIIWLRGLQRENANAYNRGIYIHGTPQESAIGRPASYGCVRMCSKDVTEVYSQLQIGQLVCIIPDSLPKLPKFKGNPSSAVFTAQAPNGKASSAPMKTAEKANSKQKRGSAASPVSGHNA
jgi:lipoprotein-anchoring transpeptidase ErfK/SrfK